MLPLTISLPSFHRITWWNPTSPASDLALDRDCTQAASLSSVLILLDLLAAFDTVNHSILLSSLAATGICGTALDWIKSYLSGRLSQVTWAGNVSTPCPLVTGVPQGSVLGPLLFSMYTRSLGPVISAIGMSYHCYADYVTSSPSARNLRVVMENMLSLTENIIAVTRTCMFFLYNIQRIPPFLTTCSTQLLVQAMVLSHLDYCNSLLAGLLASAVRPLQLIL